MPPGSGAATIDHAVPFHRSMRYPVVEASKWPTAVQSDAEGHAIPARSSLFAPATFGLAMIDHVVPFHCSISVRHGLEPDPLSDRPTATQPIVVRHETLLSLAFVEPVGFGLATTDQPVPFHRMLSVREAFVALMYEPAAKHALELVHDTPSRVPAEPPAGFGLGRGAQLVPFQRSTSGRKFVPSEAVPTAKHSVLVPQETAERLLCCKPAGSAASTTDQELPFHCSMSSESAPLRSEPLEEVAPTAKQRVGVAHAISRSSPVASLVLPAGSGAGTNDHLVPVPSPTNGRAWPRCCSKVPTPKQLVVVGHVTPSKRARAGDAMFGLGLIDQPGVVAAGAAETSNPVAVTPTRITHIRPDRRRRRMVPPVAPSAVPNLLPGAGDSTCPTAIVGGRHGAAGTDNYR